ncbi:MAG: hypothetical protein PHV68_08350 [Candidatus Gastranaerophilales bacterium]|nr:hypothetical protein [Candidatus Gastranaerophilales bacterium]
MVNFRVGEVIKFFLSVFEGLGILLENLSNLPDNEGDWKVQTVNKDFTLGNIIEVQNGAIFDAEEREAFQVRRIHSAYIKGLIQEEYRPSVLNRSRGGSKKKSKAKTARWAGIEAGKANGTWHPKVKPPKQKKGKGGSSDGGKKNKGSKK